MLPAMRIVPVPCLRDNYAYLVIDDDQRAAVVDPSEDGPVREAAEREGVQLSAIWLTHHHWDHVGGVEALTDALGIDVVLGGDYDLEQKRIPRQSRGLGDGERFDHGGSAVEVLTIPGHTLGAIAYLVDGHLFTGDMLFLGGCGRVFEGTMEQMMTSLDRLRKLPGETQVWCGHEYTVKNLDFARTVEPGNDALAERHAHEARRRDEGELTVPGTMRQELQTNPFLRFDVPEVAQGRDALTAFTAIRKAKDRF
jgi:hydroxyacylglutathione hydrolase